MGTRDVVKKVFQDHIEEITDEICQAIDIPKANDIKPEEVFDLFTGVAEYTLPRLKIFKEQSCSHPVDLTEKEWDKILDQIIEAFEIVLDDSLLVWTEEQRRKVDEGLQLFSKWYLNLWD